MATPIIQSEDRELDSGKRRQLQANAADAVRNFAVASWALRKHLDFVSRFHFKCKTGDDETDRQVESLVEEWSLAENCDVAGRHSLSRFIRLKEARACVDGDILTIMLADGRLQAVESDRIRQLDVSAFAQAYMTGASLTDDPPGWINGVRVDKYGKALEYAVCRRRSGGYEFERAVNANWALFHGYFDRFDQVRGISPLAPGLNSLRDVYENFDYALAKAKVSQLFGIAFYSDKPQATGIVEEDDDGDSDEPKYKVNLGGGPMALELEPGDKAEVIESKQPSDQFQSFTQSVIQVALKALDIPFCFYDESHTNFYGSKAAVTLYIESCKPKRNALRAHLDRIIRWKIQQWVLEGKLSLPTIETVDNVTFEWVHAGLPWWDPAKEIAADVAAVESGLRSRTEIRKERYGDDWGDVIEQLAAENEKMKELGCSSRTPKIRRNQ